MLLCSSVRIKLCLTVWFIKRHLIKDRTKAFVKSIECSLHVKLSAAFTGSTLLMLLLVKIYAVSGIQAVVPLHSVKDALLLDPSCAPATKHPKC